MSAQDYIAYVRGTLWDGSAGNTEYHFTHYPSESFIRQRAFDFHKIERVRIVKVTTNVIELEEYSLV